MAFVRLLRMTSGETTKLHVSQLRGNQKKKSKAKEARGKNKGSYKKKKRHTHKHRKGCQDVCGLSCSDTVKRTLGCRRVREKIRFLLGGITLQGRAQYSCSQPGACPRLKKKKREETGESQSQSPKRLEGTKRLAGGREEVEGSTVTVTITSAVTQVQGAGQGRCYSGRRWCSVLFCGAPRSAVLSF